MTAYAQSDYGLSAIILHQHEDVEEKLIVFALQKREKNKINRKIFDNEAMAIIVGVKRFYHFFWKKKCILRKHNKAL